MRRMVDPVMQIIEEAGAFNRTKFKRPTTIYMTSKFFMDFAETCRYTDGQQVYGMQIIIGAMPENAKGKDFFVTA